MAQQLPTSDTDEASRGPTSSGESDDRVDPTAPSMAPRTRPVLPGSLVGLLILLAVLAYRHLLLWDPGQPGLPDLTWFFFGSSDTTPQIVFAIVAGLLYRRRRDLAEGLREGGSPRRATPLLVVGFLVFLWGHYVAAPDLILISLVSFGFGAALLLFGPRFARALALPMLLLLFAMPIPAALNNQIIFPLQLLTTRHTAGLLGLLGIPVAQEGDMLHLTDSRFEVIESCSGLRSIEVLTMLAVAWVCFFPAGRLHAVLLIAAAPLIAYGINTLRVLSLVLNPESEVSAMHALQGVGLFLGGFGLLYAWDSVLRRIVGRGGTAGKAPAPVTAGSGDGEGGPGRRRPIALAALLAVMWVASMGMPRWSPPESAERPPLDLPETIGDWTLGKRLKPDRLFLGTTGFEKHSFWDYEKGEELASVFISYDDRLRRDRSLLSPKHAFPGRGWHVEQRGLAELEEGRAPVRWVLARSGANRVLTYHWYRGTEGLAGEVLRSWSGSDRSPLRRETGAVVVRLATRVEPVADGRGRAETRLRELYQHLLPRLAKQGGAT